MTPIPDDPSTNAWHKARGEETLRSAGRRAQYARMADILIANVSPGRRSRLAIDLASACLAATVSHRLSVGS